jgi:hypothetical protein
MTFNENWVLERLGQDALDRLKNKLTGGKSNDNGHKFEIFNCLFEIIDHTYSYETDEAIAPNKTVHHPSEVLITQGAFAFVDDVLIDTPEISRFLQIKAVNDMGWSEDLQLDFDYQTILMEHAGRPYRLELVVHD